MENKTAKWGTAEENELLTHPFPLFPLSPNKDLYLFLALQLFVLISIHLSSLRTKSSPQECGEGPLDEEYDGSKFPLKYTHASHDGPACGWSAFIILKHAVIYSPAFFFVYAISPPAAISSCIKGGTGATVKVLFDVRLRITPASASTST